ncbi:MAG: tRNA pseudouridine(55) synthase TruB [Leucobacter sp.]
MSQGAIVLVDKNEGWTSHDVVAKSRRALGTRKVGHAGTLDPMATGLLVLGAGPATRLLTHLVGLDKTYETTIRLGSTTVTDDREGEVTATANAEDIARVLADPARIAAAVAKLTGAIEQSPSAVSAIKVDGKRAYDRVRAGETVELKKRPVTIHSFEIGEPRVVNGGIDIDASVRCSTGTYVRALARDLGADLGIGGHLTVLRRTEVGPFRVDAATKHAQLVGDPDTPGDAGVLHAPADIARILFPALELTPDEARDLSNGKRLPVDPERHAPAPLVAAILPAASARSDSDSGSGSDAATDRLVGLVEIRGGRTRVVTNFPAPADASPVDAKKAGHTA